MVDGTQLVELFKSLKELLEMFLSKLQEDTNEEDLSEIYSAILPCIHHLTYELFLLKHKRLPFLSKAEKELLKECLRANQAYTGSDRLASLVANCLMLLSVIDEEAYTVLYSLILV